MNSARAHVSTITRTAVEDMMKVLKPRLTPEIKRPTTGTTTPSKPRPK